MFLVGLTGGIAAGKSTVAAHWVSLGAVEIDADVLAREAVAPHSKGAAAIRAAFGDEVFGSDDVLDRKALAAQVFADSEKRIALEAIIHPLVRQRSASEISAAAADAIVVYSVPLLVEAEVDLPFDFIVTVEAPHDKKIERMVSHRAMTVEEAQARIAAQASPAQRANVAHAILNSNQSLDLLIKDAGKLWFKIEQLAEAKRKAAN
ncbi:MAG: dephospho-CoA kinase [Actinomycetes bacterium]